MWTQNKNALSEGGQGVLVLVGRLEPGLCLFSGGLQVADQIV
jgi:hypothetical protein